MFHPEPDRDIRADTLWYSYCPGPNAVGIAGAHGWLADEFAPDAITVRTLSSASAPRRAVRDAHQLVPDPERFPHLLRHGGNPPALVALSKGVDLRILGLTWTEGARRVLALGESEIRSPDDLAGRRLGVPRRDGMAVDYVRSVTLRTYAEALASAGLTFADVELVEIEAGPWGGGHPAEAKDGPTSYTQGIGSARSNASAHRDEAIALIRGEADVIAAEHAQAAHLQATLRLHTVFDTAGLADPRRRASGDQPLVLTATGALVDERPDLVARFIARALQAADWARDDAVEARRIIAADVGLPEELVDDAYSADVHAQLTIDLDARGLEGLETQREHLAAHGFLSGDVDLRAVIDPGPLAVARELRTESAAPVAA